MPPDNHINQLAFSKPKVVERLRISYFVTTELGLRRPPPGFHLKHADAASTGGRMRSVDDRKKSAANSHGAASGTPSQYRLCRALSSATCDRVIFAGRRPYDTIRRPVVKKNYRPCVRRPITYYDHYCSCRRPGRFRLFRVRP